MRTSPLLALLTLSAVSLVGCLENSSSGEGPLPVTGGFAGVGNAGAGGAGSSGTSGSGGTGSGAASGSSGQAGVGGGTAGSGGSTVGQVCGGLGGDGISFTCAAGEFCDYPDDYCGAADGPGVCKLRPTSCPDGCTAESPVCACDGQTYCSTCEANKAGVDLSVLGCGQGGSGGAAGSGGSGGGTLGKACGGLTQEGSPTCDPDQFCDYADADICGNTDGQGVCKLRPTSCPACAPGNKVCACNGQLFCSQCEANKVGTDVYGGSCNPAGATFACGTRVCKAASEYCEVQISDTLPLPDLYTCKPLPTACEAGTSCGCLKGEPCVSFSCEQTSGGYTLTCPGG